MKLHLVTPAYLPFVAKCRPYLVFQIAVIRKDIEELPLGIDFINTLKPVKFTWNMRDGAKLVSKKLDLLHKDLDEAQIDADAEDYLSLVT